MATFSLINLKSRPDSLTGRFTFTQTNEYKLGMAFYGVFYLIATFADDFGYDWFVLPGFILALLGIVFAYIPYSFTKKAGVAKLTQHEIDIQPGATIKSSNLPESTLQLSNVSQVTINMIRSFQWFSSYHILQIVVDDKKEQKSFGMIIKNRKQEEQYLELLDSWYRAGYPVKEYDQMGSRIFKINRGKNYADIQNIKEEYDLEWQ